MGAAGSAFVPERSLRAPSKHTIGNARSVRTEPILWFESIAKDGTESMMAPMIDTRDAGHVQYGDSE